MPYAELVLLFDTDNLTDVKGQLGKAFDDFSVAGDNKHTPSLMIVRKRVWLSLERELQPLVNAAKEKVALKHYEVTPAKIGTLDEIDGKGYNAIIFRGRPVVAIGGLNIVADRVGANDI
jgi:uncharacterized protein (DUF608 family)